MKKKKRHMTPDKVISVYLAPGPYKVVAYDHGISPAHVCQIKLGHQHAALTAQWRDTARLNATLITMTFKEVA